MDHTAVVRQKMTERYLLDELDPEMRDEFEEHYFDCTECARDISAGAQVCRNTRKRFWRKTRNRPPGHAVRTCSPGMVSWLRPAFAAPALALLLAVVGYQNLVTYPTLQSELNQPQVLPAVSVNFGTWGAGGTPTAVPEGKGLLLFVRIPPDAAYARYTADLYAPGRQAGGLFQRRACRRAGSMAGHAPSRIPAQPGTYTMAVHGFTAGGESKELGNTSFELQIRN